MIITLALHNAGVNDAFCIILGVFAAIIAGGVMALIHGVVSINFRANQIVSGVAINIIALGLTSYLVYVLTPAGEGVPSLPPSLRLPTPSWDRFQIFRGWGMFSFSRILSFISLY